MRRLPAALLAAALLAAATATPVEARTLRAGKAVDRSCGQLLPAGTAGVARSRERAAVGGLLEVRLNGRRGDWDVAVFDAASGRLAGAAATFGPRERLASGLKPGQEVVIQACRRSGGSARASLRTRLHPLPAARGPRQKMQIVRVALLGEKDHARLEALGLDVTHNHDRHARHVDVATYSDAERLTLLRNGFLFEVTVPDMAAATRKALRAPAPSAARAAQTTGLPSGRTAYRTPAQYAEDLKALVKDYPGIVRRVEIGRSLEDRPIEGVEIAADVAATDDGRPTLAVLGLHHAREWPSGEMPMEFAIDLAKNHGKSIRVTELLKSVRILVLPIINPDGFEVSRNAPVDQQISETGAYKRKNCRPASAQSAALPCALRANEGVDLNRNYGAFWGGVGSSTSTTSQSYRGTNPYSEPESEAVHKLSQTRNIVTIISHHTFTTEGTWLRQPGFCKTAGACKAEIDVVPDEAGMKALGDVMAFHTGWLSQLGWAIGEITGATEDWNYFATGAYGYTPEQRGSNFHPTYSTAVIGEYLGTTGNSRNGVREALLQAAEQAAGRAGHSVLRGTAAPGHVLRLRKTFLTDTAIKDVRVEDALNLTTRVRPDGTFEWDVNPSTRPLATAPERYVLTCETTGGEVKETVEVQVARGAATTLELACGRPKPVPAAQEPPPPKAAPPLAEPDPAPAPTPVQPRPVRPPPRVTIARPALSARRFNRKRAFRVALRVDGGELRGVVAELVDRRKRVIARADVDRLPGDARVRLKAARKQARLARGRYTLRIVAADRRGRTVRAAAPVRVRR